MNKKKERRDVYQMITDRIITQLEEGIVPWKKPWSEGGLPCNLISLKPYRGINILLLSSLHYSKNYFLSYRQVQLLGGRIRRGEKAHVVVFWKRRKIFDEKENEFKIIPFLKYYLVYNVDQCKGIESLLPPLRTVNDPIARCESIVERMPNKPAIVFNENEAYYNPSLDIVNMPKMSAFTDSENYYETLFHELIHSTGHQQRLNRFEIVVKNHFGSQAYSIEELTAEIGTCYLKSHAGIATDKFKNNVSYIQSWLERLKNDKRFIVYAATQSQKAADYILNFGMEENGQAEPILQKEEEVKV